MNVLISGYCVVEPSGQLLIGTYKRALRLGMGLHDRGHRVALHAGGRDFYEDDLTRRAHQAFDLFHTEMPDATVEEVREGLRRQVARFKPDVVVLAEVPMGGPMLEVALCAVEEGIPLVFLDNVYNPHFARYFLRTHAPMADAVMFTGVSSCHGLSMPPFVCQVPPFIEPRADAARALIGEVAAGRRIVVVFGYDEGVKQLGLRIIEAIARDIDLQAVVVSRSSPDPQAQAAGVIFVQPPNEETLAGLLEISDLVIGKCAFQQITESLMLGKPFIGLYYKHFFNADILPQVTRTMVHTTSRIDPDVDTIAAARRFLSPTYQASPYVHERGGSAVDRAVDFLESLPRTPRDGTSQECADLGFTPERVQAALGRDVAPETVRATMVRAMDDRRIWSVVARFPQETVWHRLWGTVYPSREAFDADLSRAPREQRRLRLTDSDDRVTIEDDLGYESLPELI